MLGIGPYAFHVDDRRHLHSGAETVRYLIAHPGGLVEQLLTQGLRNTDARVQADKPVTPTFLFSLLLIAGGVYGVRLSLALAKTFHTNPFSAAIGALQGGGGSKINLKTDVGDVRIKKGSGFPNPPPSVSSIPPKPPVPPNAPHLKAPKAPPADPVTQ